MRFVRSLFLLSGLMLSLAGCGGGSSDSGKTGLSYEEQVQRALKESSPEIRANKLVKIAFERAKEGNKYGAEDTMKLARTACAEIQGPLEKAGAYALVAEYEGKLGNQRESLSAAKSAQRAADKIESVEARGKMMTKIALALAVGKQTVKAGETLADAEKVVAEVQDPPGKAAVLSDIVKVYQQLERSDDVKRVIDAESASAKAIEDPRKRCDTLCLIGAMQAELKMKDEALGTLNEAFAACESIENVYSRAYAMSEVALKLHDAGDNAKARAVLEAAENLVPQIPEVDLRGEVETKIGQIKSQLP